MSGARYTKNGLLIPTAWLKKLGRDVRVQQMQTPLTALDDQAVNA